LWLGGSGLISGDVKVEDKKNHLLSPPPKKKNKEKKITLKEEQKCTYSTPLGLPKERLPHH
jgi:hypothetical protein